MPFLRAADLLAGLGRELDLAAAARISSIAGQTVALAVLARPGSNGLTAPQLAVACRLVEGVRGPLACRVLWQIEHPDGVVVACAGGALSEGEVELLVVGESDTGAIGARYRAARAALIERAA